MSEELGNGFVWLSYAVTYGLVGGYAAVLFRRVRRRDRG